MSLEDNMQEDLEKAFEISATAPEEEEEAGGQEDRGPSEDSQEPVGATKTPEELLSEKTPLADEETEEIRAEEKTEEEPEQEATSDKAPAGWKAEVREKWKDLPADVKAEITRHSAAYAAGIQQYAEGAKFGRAIADVLAPYREIMAVEGATPAQAVANLAQHAAIMRRGTPQQKAETIANLINTYNVDIEQLDNLLAGEPALPPEQQRLLEIMEQKLQPFQETMSSIDRARKEFAQRNTQTVDQEIQAFISNPQNEFYEDVRLDMADLMDLAAKRGESLTIQQAYDKACRMSPNVSKVLEARSNRNRMVEQQKKISGKKNAASSVAGGTAGGTAAPTAETVEDALEAAWNAHSAA